MSKETVETQKLNKVKKSAAKQATNPISGSPKMPKLKAVEKPASQEAPNLVATINNFNANKTHNRLYSGYANNPITNKNVVNGNELANAVCSALKNRTDVSELFVAIHNTCSEKLNSIYTGFGLYHETSNVLISNFFQKSAEHIHLRYSNQMLKIRLWNALPHKSRFY